MTRQERADRVGAWLDDHYPAVPIPLDHTNPFTLLVAVILSAQTTDKKVNEVTPALFRRAPDAATMAMLRANVGGASTLAASGVYHVVIDLAVGSPDVSVEAWTGNRLTGNLCVGAYNPYGNPVVNATWTPISGTLDLTLTPGGGYGGTGDLVFTDVHFEDGTGRVGRIDHLEIHGNWPLFPP